MTTSELLTATLPNGESAALAALDVLRVPHVEVFQVDGRSESEVLTQSRRDFAALLSEVHYAFSGVSSGGSADVELALELRWRSVRVEAQAHEADVRLTLAVRALGSDSRAVAGRAEEALRVLREGVGIAGYELGDVGRQELSELVSPPARWRSVALLKEEWIEELQNQAVPYAYAFRPYGTEIEDLSRLSQVLTATPDAAISIQLIPTSYTGAERQALESTSLALANVGSSVSAGGGTPMEFSGATRVGAIYDYYAANKDSPLFLHALIVSAKASDIPVVAGRVLSQLTAVGGAPAARAVDVTEAARAASADPLAYPWRIAEHLLNETRDPALWGAQNPGDAYFRLGSILTAEEAAQVFRLPMGGARLGAGFQISRSAESNRNYAEGVVGNPEITAGTLSVSTRKVPIGYALQDLTKHAFITGTPGSGKTTFTFGLLDTLWRDHNVPYLILEPAKTEYRALLSTTPDLQVFTPGKSSVSPFIMNPFEPPANVRLEAFKSVLKTAFAAGVTMTTPLDKIFDETVTNVYAKFGWFDSDTTGSGGRPFTIQDFILEFRRTFEAIGYTGDAQNIGRAGLVRLGALAQLFDNVRSVPIHDLVTRPSLIELAGVENAEDKALLISLLLLNVLAYVNANVPGDGRLKFVIVLEEAHVLLDADERASESGDANPARVAKGLISRMLAEIRSYGVGLIIADQSPRKVGSDIVALTNLKLGFRLVEAEDKAILAASTNMSEAQVERLSRLRPGEAFLYHDRLEEPEEILTPDYRAQRGISIFLDDAGLAERSSYWQKHAELLVPNQEWQLIGDWDPTVDSVAKQLARRLFNEQIGPNAESEEVIRPALARLDSFVEAEVAGRFECSNLLHLATRLHLLRFVKYGSRIRVSDETIALTLTGERARLTIHPTPAPAGISNNTRSDPNAHR